LILSTYQDGTGHEHAANGTTIPGFRQFERALAVAVGGSAPENKKIFDVLVPAPDGKQLGISCKMREELNSVDRNGYVYIEVSNARAQFVHHLNQIGIHDVSQYRSRPRDTGIQILDWIRHLHNVEESGRRVDLENSTYLVLLYSKKTSEFQLFQYRCDLFISDAGQFDWSVPQYVDKEGNPHHREHLCGEKDGIRYVQWFWAAGHLKFFPRVQNATWKSEKFMLEPLPNTELTIVDKAKDYFPEQWQQACDDTEPID